MIKILDTGHSSHFSYGPRINPDEEGLEDIVGGFDLNTGCCTYYDDSHPRMFMNNLMMEYATVGKGDTREPAIDVRYSNGLSTLDLVYCSHRVFKGKDMGSIPAALPDKEGSETLELVLKIRSSTCMSIFSTRLMKTMMSS